MLCIQNDLNSIHRSHELRRTLYTLAIHIYIHVRIAHEFNVILNNDSMGKTNTKKWLKYFILYIHKKRFRKRSSFKTNHTFVCVCVCEIVLNELFNTIIKLLLLWNIFNMQLCLLNKYHKIWKVT